MSPAQHSHRYFFFFSGLFLLSLVLAVLFDLYYLVFIPFAVLLFYAGWQYRELLFLLLLASLPFSVEMMVTSSSGTDFPDEPLMVATAFLFFCHWLYSPVAISQTAKTHPLVLLLLATWIWSLVPVLFSTYPIISLKFLAAKCWYIGAFLLAPLIVFLDKRRLKQAAATLFICLSVVTMITIVRHASYGFSFSHINDALRPFFRNHVNYSAMLVCGLPLGAAIYKLAASQKTRYVVVVAMAILLMALFLSYSRGAWLALIAGLLAAWLIKRRILVAGYLISLLILLAALFWLKSDGRYLDYAPNYRTTIFHENFREHIEATYEFRDMSTTERFYRWIAGVRMIKDNALTGYGPGTFYHNYKPYAVPAFRTYVSDNKEQSTVHNYFLLIAVEQGIPGLLLLLLLIGAMLYYAQGLYHRAADRFYKVVAMACGVALTMILTVNFLSDLIEIDKIGSLFFLCLSLLVITDISTRKISNPTSHVQRVS